MTLHLSTSQGSSHRPTPSPPPPDKGLAWCATGTPCPPPSLSTEPPSSLCIPQIPLSHLLPLVPEPWHLPAEEAGKVPAGDLQLLPCCGDHCSIPPPTGSLCFSLQLLGWPQRVGQPPLFNPSWINSRVPGCPQLPAPWPVYGAIFSTGHRVCSPSPLFW